MGEAVILAAGKGRRMGEPDGTAAMDSDQARAADDGWKGLMPFGGRPLVAFSVRELRSVGVERVLLVIRPSDREVWRQGVESGSFDGVDCILISQPEAKGTAHALSCCESSIEGDRFLLVNSDNYYPREALALLVEDDRTGVSCLGLDLEEVVSTGRSNLDADRLRQWAVLEVDPDGYLLRIVEKPRPEAIAGAARRPLVSPNAWCLNREIFAACSSIRPSVRGELELPSAIQYAIDRLGCRVRVHPTSEPILDLSARSDIAAVERLLPAWPPEGESFDR